MPPTLRAPLPTSTRAPVASTSARARSRVRVNALDVGAFALSGGIAACASHSLSVPLDVIKTRLQCEKFDDATVLGVGAAIVRREGVGALTAGWESTFFGYGAQGALKYGGFEFLKRCASASAGGDQSALGLLALVACAASAEVVGSAVLTPLEQIRIKTVSDSRYAGDSFAAAARRFASEPNGGLSSVASNLPVVYAKMLPYTAVQLVSYDVFNRTLASMSLDSATTRPAAALAAGVLASLASQPGDTLLSATNAGRCVIVGDDEDTTASPRPRRSPLDVAIELGPVGLMTGWRARIAHVTLIVFAQLLVYDAVKDVLASPR